MRALKGMLGAIVIAFAVSVGGPAAAAVAGPEPTITSPKGESTTGPAPSFRGATGATVEGEAAEITLRIYEGSGTGGEVKTTLHELIPSPVGGEWFLGPSPALTEGEYTAQVTQTNQTTTETGTSGAVTFHVVTSSPTVTLKGPTSPSGNTKPSFSGKDTDPTEAVEVHIFNEANQETTATASPAGGNWSTSNESELASGNYHAYATQASSLGNEAGKSNEIFFTINTASPTVTITGGPESLSGNTKPSFSGKDTDPTEAVEVHISNEANQETTATASPAGGNWSTSNENTLPSGNYHAYATQASSLGNEAGKSNEIFFTINTASPTVTITGGPESLSGNTKPSFSGKDTDPTEAVEVHISNEANQETTATASPAGGNWSTSNENTLPSGNYHAYATQASSLGNEAGKSNEIFFTINTSSPTVTLNGPAKLSNETDPTFSGKASDPTEGVVVYIRNTGTGETETATAKPSAGNWSTSNETALGSGTYTAYATQGSSLGNKQGESSGVEFTINTSPPTVALEPPETPSNKTRPSFTGTATEHTQVTVHVHDSHGNEVAKATANGTGGAWSSGQTNESLEGGEYTAVATQESSLGNGTGHSNTVSFTVNTKPPTVSLHTPTSPTNDTTLSFTGFASDTTTVTVKISKEGTPFAEATAQGNGGEWTSGAPSRALTSGQYTAVAVQPSSLGNSPGTSETVSFTVETGPPKVTLNQPKTPSNHTTPSFTGTASDHTTVIVDIYTGEHAEGPVFAEATATGTGSSWSSGAANKTLTTGEYTAVATQESSLLGNPTGVSSTVSFFVDTRSPTVTIEQPSPLSNKANPTFKGTASDSTPVVVHVFNKANAEVTSVTTTPSGGEWSTNGEGTLESETYSVYATQRSSLENPQGESSHVTFTINTKAPTVTLNESSVARRSNNTTPSFSGTATDTTTVTVRIFEGSHEVTSTTAAGTGGTWSTLALSQALAGAPGPHSYTAIAEQPSSLGNPTGKSNSVTFTVDTSAPTVTLAQPTTPSNNTTPSFTGTASEAAPVTVRVYEEPKENEKHEVAKLTAAVTGGAWVTSPVTLATGTHKYSAVASQASEINNGTGESAPVKFTVDTTAPKVTLNAVPKSPSNNAQPEFSGTASDKEPVTVAVYELNKTERKLVATAEAKEPKTTWTSLKATPALPVGNREYAAVATQKSSINNPAGTSNEIKFIVDTTSPLLTISPVPTPSNNVAPSFSGTAIATHASPEVTVKVYLDTATGRSEVAKAKATITGTTWATGPASPALAKGTNVYTAVAIEESLLGNISGTAEVTFTVNTEPPAVTLIGPPASSNNRIPVFEGTASDTTPVTLKVYEGVRAEGKEVASAVAPLGAGGAWRAEATLPLVKRTYTAIAVQKSSIGNADGKSKTATFLVDPAAPAVSLTPPPLWTNNATPSFTGNASDNSLVTITIYPGVKPEGQAAVASATATGTNGPWISGPTSSALRDGQYTAVASQENSVTHADVGDSNSVTFHVDTGAPQVTLTSPANGSSSGSPTWTVSGAAGTAEGDLTHVTAQLFSGSSIGAGQAPAQSITVNTNGKTWSTTFGGLSAGTYTVRAVQADLAGNVGVSSPATFVVTGSSSAAASGGAAPAASFSWFPAAPTAGQSISLVSSSTDVVSPITAFAWDLAGTGAFAIGGPEMMVTFPTAGSHLVQLRVTAANGLSSVASSAIAVSPPALPLMQPFPIVRITSSATSTGVRLKQLSVLAASGAKITVACRGRGCPIKSQSHMASVSKRRTAFVEFRRFERALKAGVILEVRVSKPGQTGKYTRFAVRRRKLPVRFDACLDGVLVKPVSCPSS